MSTSVYKKDSNSFNYYEDVRIVVSGLGTFRVTDDNELNVTAVDLTSEKEKFLISFYSSPYHFFYDSLGHLLNAIDLNKNATFVFNTNDLKKMRNSSFYYFIKKIIQNNDIDVLEIEPNDCIKINKFYHVGIDFPPIPEPTKRIYDLLINNISSNGTLPDKKVYISRKQSEDNNTYYNLDSRFVHPKNRIDDEQILEDFFKSHGFDIVYAEEFKTVEDQVLYMNSVKTMVCLTGSGFLNCLLMQEKCNFIEIVTPMTVPAFKGDAFSGPWVQSLHHFGSNLAFHKNHYYYTVNNHDLQANSVIDSIKNNKSLMELIREQ